MLSIVGLFFSVSVASDFSLLRESGGNSSYEVILLGHRHAGPENPDFVENYRASERFILGQEDVRSSKVAVLSEGVNPGDLHPNRATLFPKIDPGVTITGWDHEHMNRLALSFREWSDSLNQKQASGFDELVLRHAVRLVADEVAVIYRNRVLMAAIEEYAAKGITKIYIIAGTDHVYDFELSQYLLDSKIRHQIWVEQGKDLEGLLDDRITKEIRFVQNRYGAYLLRHGIVSRVFLTQATMVASKIIAKYTRGITFPSPLIAGESARFPGKLLSDIDELNLRTNRSLLSNGFLDAFYCGAFL